MGHLIEFKGEKASNHDVLNLLYQVEDDNRIYIMDNHLAASWCWAKQIDESEKYTLIHIDRHYDLSSCNLSYDKIDVLLCFTSLNENNAEGITGLIDNENNQQLFNWSNYIYFFNEAFPEVLNSSYFIVDDVKTDSDKGDKQYKKLTDCKCIDVNNLPDINNSIILNLDIDFFCSSKESNEYGVREDYKSQIEFLKNWYLKNKANVKVFTIALSPEMCSHNNGWEVSKSILMEVSEALELNIKLENIFNNDTF